MPRRSTKRIDLDTEESESGDLNDMTDCTVCYEHFDTTVNIPRILPCSHTVCEMCILKLLSNKSLTCPQCRKKHAAKSGLKAFPQNKYIFRIIELEKDGTANVFDACSVHDSRALNMLCKKEGCGQDICQLCLIESHSGHRVVDYLEEDKKFVGLEESMVNCKEILITAKGNFKGKCRETVQKLKAKKSQQMKMFDALIKQASDELKGTDILFTRPLLEVNNILNDLVDINSESRSRNEIKKRVQIVGKMQETLDSVYKKNFVVKNYECEEENQICKDLVEKTLSVKLLASGPRAKIVEKGLFQISMFFKMYV